MLQSSSEFRTVLNVTFAFAMSCYARFFSRMEPLPLIMLTKQREIDPYLWVGPSRRGEVKGRSRCQCRPSTCPENEVIPLLHRAN
jgi:hypothetical protein